MKVNISHSEKRTGLVFGKTHYGVTVQVTFNDEEAAVIEARKLHHDIIMERDYPSDVDAERHESRGLARKLATAAFAGADANHFHLTVSKLMKGPDTHHFSTPAEAKMYEADLKEALKRLKGWIEGNAQTGVGDSFEL